MKEIVGSDGRGRGKEGEQRAGNTMGDERDIKEIK